MVCNVERRSVLQSVAGVLCTLGGALLISRATGWTDPFLWIGVAALTLGALIFMWLLVPPWLTDRQTRRARSEQLALEGRANQRTGLDEIMIELGQISSQLKGELRWGQRGPLSPNTAWTKNRHLVTGEARTLVESAYKQAHVLDEEALSAAQAELDEKEAQQRQEAKQTVDAAAEAIRDLRDEVQP
jgi:hypothetical protein